MTHLLERQRRPGAAFTLIELLVVIAMIGVLAGLAYPVMGALNKKKKVALVRGELNQLQTAIEAYKSKRGFYPPDNPGNPVTNQLYFELNGTVLTNINGVDYFVTLDGSSRIMPSEIPLLFQASPAVSSPRGFVNCSRNSGGTDEHEPAQNFHTGLKPAQIGEMVVIETNKAILVCSLPWAGDWQIVTNKGPVIPHAVKRGLNPWRYVSSNPVHNPGAYDLWLEFPVGSKLYRLSNWSQQTEVVLDHWPPE